jgi:hypothetical protein
MSCASRHFCFVASPSPLERGGKTKMCSERSEHTFIDSKPPISGISVANPSLSAVKSLKPALIAGFIVSNQSRGVKTGANLPQILCGMNRLVIIGNGFDRAHGLPTGYNDFMLWLFQQKITQVIEELHWNDEYFEIKRNFPISSIKEFRSLKELETCIVPDFRDITLERRSLEGKRIFIRINDHFIETIFRNAASDDPDWADIEKTYYLQLLHAVAKVKKDEKKRAVTALNKALYYIKEHLCEYLMQLPEPNQISGYHKILRTSAEPFDVCMLSFNYTRTHLMYLPTEDQLLHKQRYQAINIHGDIHEPHKNPLIFGFGDEVDRRYRMLQDEDLNCVLDNIKSIGYFQTSKYDELIRFINSGNFEVHVVGHSLGLSDRTLLHTIFNHDNCHRIRIYWHGDDIGNNNFKTLTQQLTGHFYDTDFNRMRDKVVKLNISDRMPQWNDSSVKHY